MPWQQVGIMEQRIEFVVRAARGEQSMTALCEEFRISRASGHAWKKRWLQQGLEGLREGSRRPRHSPTETAEKAQQRVIELRQQRPDWGARKLRELLLGEGVQLPVSTVHRILKRRGLAPPPERTPSQGKRFEREQPNDLWQMDYKGPLQGPSGTILPLSVLDDHSRYMLGLKAHRDTQAEPARKSLEEIFRQNGLPRAMLMDHGTPWWNGQGWGWTWLTVWLMRQGIELIFSGIRHPQTQGKVERFHGSLKRAWKLRGPHQDEQGWLEEFRQEYNHVRPHEALGMSKPAGRWKPSERRYQEQLREWEYPPGSEVRQLGVGGQLWLNNRRWEVSRALAGQRVALERLGSRVLLRYCATVLRELDLEQGRNTTAEVRPLGPDGGAARGWSASAEGRGRRRAAADRGEQAGAPHTPLGGYGAWLRLRLKAKSLLPG